MNCTSKKLHHRLGLQDYMYHVVETAPLPNGRALWVLDLKGGLVLNLRIAGIRANECRHLHRKSLSPRSLWALAYALRLIFHHSHHRQVDFSRGEVH